MSEGRGALRFRRLWQVLGAALVVAVIGLSLTPTPPQPLGFDGADKLEHLFAYGVLMGWYMQLYATVRARAAIAAALVALGISLEILQALGGARTYDLADMAANGSGVLLTWALLPAPATAILHTIEARLRRG